VGERGCELFKLLSKHFPGVWRPLKVQRIWPQVKEIETKEDVGVVICCIL
jgi:hypothetical protein